MKNLIIVMLFSAISLMNFAQKQGVSEAGFNLYLNVPEGGVLSSGPIPEMNAFTSDGDAIKVNDLCKGKYTVLAAGCLTCPLFHQNYPEIEAAYADYKDKGVQFFYFYKYLRHPELDGYVQAQNISERLLQLAEARKKLGTKVPWIADTMEDDIRVGLRSGSWSVFLISPEGEVIYGSGSIEAKGLRNALTKAVGPVVDPTNTDELDLPKIARNEKLENRDSDLGVARPDGLTILKIVPHKAEETYYVKLRAEAEEALLVTGTGRLFLGFYPDPIHDVHWNNLAPPMQYKLSLPEGVNATPTVANALKGTGDGDTKPRQFWVDIVSDKPFRSIELKLDYYACTADMCLPLTHEYTIQMENENRGSRTYGMNKGNKGNSGGSSSSRSGSGDKRMLMERMDVDKDGYVSFDEMYTQMQKRQGNNLSRDKAKIHFDKLDLNNDGLISSDELLNAPQRQENTKRTRK
jgi:hypothetical protein